VVEVASGTPTGISCASASSCTIVDDYGAAVSGDGAESWSAPVSVVPFGRLTAVACPSVSFCAAAGRAGAVAIEAAGTWTSGRLAAGSDLTSIACPSSSLCFAGGEPGVVEEWSGGAVEAWSPLSADPGHVVSGIACVSTTDCVAVDDAGSATTWNGTSWSDPVQVDGSAALVSVSCDPTGALCLAVARDGTGAVRKSGTWSVLAAWSEPWISVSCVTTTFCMAVDDLDDAVVFNGTSWSDSVPLDFFIAVPAAVSCVTTTFCVVADSQGDVHTYSNGLWSASVHADLVNFPYAAACASVSLCVVGDTTGHAITFNGTGWSAPAPTGLDVVVAVDCVSGSFCMAIDAHRVAVWTGGGWTSHTLSNGFAGPRFTSLACTSRTFCLVSDDGGNIYVYDGSSWSEAGSIDGSTAITSIACASSARCVALDQAGRLLGFDGRTWSSPDYLDARNHPQSVSCGGTQCVAVDARGNALYFAGRSWTAPTRAFATAATSVSCIRSNYCYAVVNQGKSVAGFGRGLAAKTDPVSQGTLSGVACASGPTCVGFDPQGRATRAT